MTSKTPSVSVRFEVAKKALQGPAQVLLLGPLGPGGTAAAGTTFKVINEANTRQMVGKSDINDAVKLWFAAGLQQQYDLFVLPYDTSGWTPNSWTLTVAGTAAESGTLNFRYGGYYVPVAVVKDNEQNAIASKLAAAITAANVPLVAAATDNQVVITAEYVGLHTQRFALSVDLYRDRGELGIDGVNVAVTNDENGSGEPAFDATAITEHFDWYLHPFRSTAYLDALESYLQAGWDARNSFAHAILATAGIEASISALGEPRNDAHHSYIAIADAPIFELSAAVAFLHGLQRQIRDEGKPNVSGQRMELPHMPAFPSPLDAEVLLDAGVTPLRSQRATVLAVRAVANRRKNDEGAEDLRQFDISAVLALREIGIRLTLWAIDHLGKGIVADGTPLTPRMVASTTSAGELRGSAVEVLKGLRSDAIIFAESEDAIDKVLSSIEPIKQGAILAGFELVFDPELVRNVTHLDIFVRYN